MKKYQAIIILLFSLLGGFYMVIINQSNHIKEIEEMHLKENLQNDLKIYSELSTIDFHQNIISQEIENEESNKEKLEKHFIEIVEHNNKIRQILDSRSNIKNSIEN